MYNVYGDTMVKTLRVKEDTYELVMHAVGSAQIHQKKRISVDTVLKTLLKDRKTKPTRSAWALVLKATGDGPKTDCVKETDTTL